MSGADSLHGGAEALLVITTVDDGDVATELAREAVEQRLAACVHVLCPGRSVYLWEGQVEEAQEHTLLLKTSVERHDALESWLASRHPYETPEIITLPISSGLPDYIDWIEQCTR